jgi:hypothetical protein
MKILAQPGSVLHILGVNFFVTNLWFCHLISPPYLGHFWHRENESMLLTLHSNPHYLFAKGVMVKGFLVSNLGRKLASCHNSWHIGTILAPWHLTTGLTN